MKATFYHWTYEHSLEMIMIKGLIPYNAVNAQGSENVFLCEDPETWNCMGDTLLKVRVNLKHIKPRGHPPLSIFSNIGVREILCSVTIPPKDIEVIKNENRRHTSKY